MLFAFVPREIALREFDAPFSLLAGRFLDKIFGGLFYLPRFGMKLKLAHLRRCRRCWRVRDAVLVWEEV